MHIFLWEAATGRSVTDLIGGLFGLMNNLSNALEFPAKLVAAASLPGTVVAYITGRRHLRDRAGKGYDGSGSEVVSNMFAQVSKDLAEIAAAIAALSLGLGVQTGAAEVPAPTPPLAASPAPAAASARPPSPAQPAPVLPVPAVPRLEPIASRKAPALTSRRGWARHPVLAIVTILCLIFTLSGGIGSFVTDTPDANGQYPAVFALFFIVWFIGLLTALVILILACIQAIVLKRWGWAIGLFLGTFTLALFTLLCAPALLILIYAVWGPVTSPGQATGVAPAAYVPYGVPMPGQRSPQPAQSSPGGAWTAGNAPPPNKTGYPPPGFAAPPASSTQVSPVSMPFTGQPAQNEGPFAPTS
jgi:hypothetical protein